MSLLKNGIPDRMTLLITGANGYIGARLIDRLISSGTMATMYCVSRSPLLSSSPNVHPILADLSVAGWTRSLPSENVQAVIHLAQSKRYREFPAGAVDMVRVNVDATAELLEWGRKIGIVKFLFASSGNVYRTSRVLLTESDPCIPSSMYAATKLSAEHLVLQYRRFFQTTVMRMFGIYGPKQQDMTIPMIVQRIQDRADIILAQGVGLSFTPLYIDDCLDVLQRLIEARIPEGSELMNISGNTVVHLGELVSLISDHLGIAPNIRVTGDEPIYLQGSNQRMRQLLNYEPMTSIHEGIETLLDPIYA
jgi:nucleoside-diphosphate-sugar epimerase